ncbi:hypothetical protein WA158_002163 [Blastocystis sp. Blastoise]
MDALWDTKKPCLLSKRLFPDTFDRCCSGKEEKDRYYKMASDKIKTIIEDDTFLTQKPQIMWGDKDFYVYNPTGICQECSLFVKIYKIFKEKERISENELYNLLLNTIEGKNIYNSYRMKKPSIEAREFLTDILQFLSKPCLLPPDLPFKEIYVCPGIIKNDYSPTIWSLNKDISFSNDNVLVHLEESYLDPTLFETAKMDHQNVNKYLALERTKRRLVRVLMDSLESNYISTDDTSVDTNDKENNDSKGVSMPMNSSNEFNNKVLDKKKDIPKSTIKESGLKDDSNNNNKDINNNTPIPSETENKDDISKDKGENKADLSIIDVSKEKETRENKIPSKSDDLSIDIMNENESKLNMKKNTIISMSKKRNLYWEDKTYCIQNYEFTYINKRALMCFWRQEIKRYTSSGNPFAYIDSKTGQRTTVPSVGNIHHSAIEDSILEKHRMEQVSLQSIVYDAFLRAGTYDKDTIVNEVYKSQYIISNNPNTLKQVYLQIDNYISLFSSQISRLSLNQPNYQQ